MHRTYQEWEEASHKTWGPATIKQAVQDIHELVIENDSLRVKNNSGISIGGHYLIGNSSAIAAVQGWEYQASIYEHSVASLSKQIKELEDGSRVRELENKIIGLSAQLALLKREISLGGELP